MAIEGSEEQGSVDVRFLYEGEVGELQAECTSLAGTYVTADLPPTVVVNDRTVPNATLDLSPGEFFVFRRWEPDGWQGDEVLGRRLK